MIVFLSAVDAARLGDLDRLDRLHAVCDGTPGTVLLDDWVDLDPDGEHVWLDVARCRQIGRDAAGDSWAEGYDRMIAYAVSKGWTDQAGARVRAHIEPGGRRDD